MTTTSMSSTMTDIFAAFILVAVLSKLLLKRKESDKYKLNAFKPKRVDRSKVQTAPPDNASAESVWVQVSIGNSSESRYNSQVANPYWRADTTPTLWHHRIDTITDPTTLKRLPKLPTPTSGFGFRLELNLRNMSAPQIGTNSCDTMAEESVGQEAQKLDLLGRRRPPCS